MSNSYSSYVYLSFNYVLFKEFHVLLAHVQHTAPGVTQAKNYAYQIGPFFISNYTVSIFYCEECVTVSESLTVTYVLQIVLPLEYRSNLYSMVSGTVTCLYKITFFNAQM